MIIVVQRPKEPVTMQRGHMGLHLFRSLRYALRSKGIYRDPLPGDVIAGIRVVSVEYNNRKAG